MARHLQTEFSVRRGPKRPFSEQLRERLEERQRELHEEQARIAAAVRCLPRRKGRPPRGGPKAA